MAIALMLQTDLSLSGRKHGSLLWLEIKNGWAGSLCSRNLQFVLSTVDVNFFSRLKDAFHSHLVKTSADVSYTHCEEVR